MWQQALLQGEVRGELDTLKCRSCGQHRVATGEFTIVKVKVESSLCSHAVVIVYFAAFATYLIESCVLELVEVVWS